MLVFNLPQFILFLDLCTSRPEYGEKRQRVTINPSFTTMFTRICIPLSPLVNVLSAPLHGNPDFVLISFTGTNPSIPALDDSGLITDCTRSWGSLLLLAPKPHQEDCNDVKDFIWRLCVSYRPLNGITRSFEFPIPRCSDSIMSVAGSTRFVYGSVTRKSLHFSLLMARRKHTKLCLSDRRMYQHFILQ